jgi:hypothetical protein
VRQRIEDLLDVERMQENLVADLLGAKAEADFDATPIRAETAGAYVKSFRTAS